MGGKIDLTSMGLAMNNFDRAESQATGSILAKGVTVPQVICCHSSSSGRAVAFDTCKA